MKQRRKLNARTASYISHKVFQRKAKLALAFVALLGGSSVNLVFPEVLRRYLAMGELSVLTDKLPQVAGILAALFLLQGISFFVRSYLFNRLGLEVVAEVRREVFAAILGREAQFFDSAKPSELAARVNGDAALVQDLISVRISVVARYFVQVVLGTLLMAWMSWRLTAALIASVLVMIGSSYFFIRHLREASRNYQGALAQLTSFVTEAFSGAKVIKSLHAQDWSIKRFDSTNNVGEQSVFELGLRRGLVSASFTSGASLLLNLLMIAVVWYGVSLLASGVLELGQFTAFALYGAIVAVSFSFLISSYGEVIQALGGVERIMELVHSPTSQGNDYSVLIEGTATSHGSPAIAIQNLAFSYQGVPDEQILHISDFQISRGEKCAVLGPSGTGKSSLIALLLGMYQPTSGTVSIYGKRVDEYSAGELASLIAWVPQEVTLFGFSIFENLTLGFERLSRIEIERKLDGWRFMDFVKELPRGLDTILGDNGVQLSGGQKQRIAVARALLRQPPILLLDEATSGLDSDTEAELLSVVLQELPQSTVIVVSHRLSTTRIATRVVVLGDGAVVQDGTHDTLKVVPGLYQRYIEHQAVL